MKRAFTITVSTAIDAMVPSVSGSFQTSIATSCDAPAKTIAFISTVSVRLMPFCAASVPNAAAKIIVPGNSAAERHAPSAIPGNVQYGACVLSCDCVVMECSAAGLAKPRPIGNVRRRDQPEERHACHADQRTDGISQIDGYTDGVQRHRNGCAGAARARLHGETPV